MKYSVYRSLPLFRSQDVSRKAPLKNVISRSLTPFAYRRINFLAQRRDWAVRERRETPIRAIFQGGLKGGLLLILPIVLLCLVSTVWGQEGPGKTLFRMHGSNTIGARLGPDLAKRFLKTRGYTGVARIAGEKANEYFIVGWKNGKQYHVEIKAHGSSTSFRSLEAGLCDVGMASRRIKDKEKKKLAFLGDMTLVENEHVLAMDGIAVIVNMQNGIDALDVTRLQGIFAGEIDNWQEVGGEDRAIRVYSRDDNSGTYDTFKKMVLQGRKLGSSALRYESNARLSDDVAVDVAGIGFVGMPYVQESKALKIKKNEKSLGYLPTTFTAAYEEYPLSRRLYLYTATDPNNPVVEEFVEFALAYEGQKSVAQLGFAKLSLDMEDKDTTVARFGKKEHNKIYKRETMRGRRVNFNFRFKAGGGELENRSQKDLQRFINYIQKPDQYYYEPVLIGINSCYQTHLLHNTIVEAIGSDNFFVPPQKICLDYATGPNGTALDAVVEVWLRTVDDGA